MNLQPLYIAPAREIGGVKKQISINVANSIYNHRLDEHTAALRKFIETGSEQGQKVAKDEHFIVTVLVE